MDARRCQGKDAGIETTAIHLGDASAAEVENLMASSRREISHRVTCLDIFGKDEMLFESDFARHRPRGRFRAIQRILGTTH